MRILVAIAGILISSMAHAGTISLHKTQINFEGEWTSRDGLTSVFTNETVLDVTTHDKILMTRDLTLQTPEGPFSFHFEWLLVDTQNGNFDIFSGESQVGTGSCKESTCHMEISDENGGMVTLDWRYEDNLIYETGSHKTNDGTEIWKGTGRIINAD